MKSKLLLKRIILFIILGILLFSCLLLIYNRYLHGLLKNKGSDPNNGEVYVSQEQYEKKITDDGFEYYQFNKNSEKVVYITRYKGESENIVIPEMIEGYKVEKLTDSAFTYCENIKTIEVNDNIENIGVSCFGGCKNLTKIKIYGDKTELGYKCFIDCPKVKIYCNKDSSAYKYASENDIDFELLT